LRRSELKGAISNRQDDLLLALGTVEIIALGLAIASVCQGNWTIQELAPGL
jgi:hypothetical protein